MPMAIPTTLLKALVNKQSVAYNLARFRTSNVYSTPMVTTDTSTDANTLKKRIDAAITAIEKAYPTDKLKQCYGLSNENNTIATFATAKQYALASLNMFKAFRRDIWPNS
jgi:hypothetical protein